MTAQPLISLIDLNNQLDLDDVCSKFLMSKFFLSILLLRAFTSWIPILSYFTILKSYFMNYTLPFYNTPNIPKLYYFTILLKYYFLIILEEEGKHKKHFFYSSSLIFFSFLSLSLSLSLCYLGLIVHRFVCLWDRRSVLRLWIMGHGSWICDMVSWVVLQLWYGFLLVVFRWVFVGYGGQIYGFSRAWWRRRRFGRARWRRRQFGRGS